LRGYIIAREPFQGSAPLWQFLALARERGSSMARVKLNPILEQVRGQVGDLVFKRYGDDVVISRKPDMDSLMPTDRQVAARDRFKQAALYGRVAMADPETKTLYEAAAKAKGQPVFSLMVADFFHAPSVDEVDMSGYGGQIGDRIGVRAHDDFAVASVALTLTDGNGVTLESGPAVEDPPNSGQFVYTATRVVAAGTAVSVRVVVTDRPGTETTAEESKMV
jgi:hypothetical protein